MSVFSVCLRIFKKNLPLLAIYFAVFVMVSTIVTIMSAPSEPGEYGNTRVRMAFFSQEDTPLAEGLKGALARQAYFVDAPDEREKLQEALFYRRVHYILRIPEGFTNAFLQGRPAALERTSIPGSASAIYIDHRIDRYLETLRLYAAAMPDIDLRELADLALSDLSADTTVVIAGRDNTAGRAGVLKYYFNFMAYTMMFAVIFGVSAIMIVFNDLDLKRRHLCSPLSLSGIGLQCFLACALFALINWIMLAALSSIFGIDAINAPSAGLFYMNSFMFTVCASCLAFLIGNLTKSREIVSAVANIITLGTSFLSGVFVPQEIIGENVLRIASFMPTYWYVRANERIAGLTDYSISSLGDVFVSLAIQAAFGGAFLVAALVIVKRRRESA